MQQVLKEVRLKDRKEQQPQLKVLKVQKEHPVLILQIIRVTKEHPVLKVQPLKV